MMQRYPQPEVGTTTGARVRVEARVEVAMRLRVASGLIMDPL